AGAAPLVSAVLLGVIAAVLAARAGPPTPGPPPPPTPMPPTPPPSCGEKPSTTPVATPEEKNCDVCGTAAACWWCGCHSWNPIPPPPPPPPPAVSAAAAAAPRAYRNRLSAPIG